jgi:DNA-sulfur modification-associated/HNH endonuclease
MNKKVVTHHKIRILDLLDNAYISSFQRLENKEHVDLIYRHLSEYYKTYNEIFLPGVISLSKTVKENEDKDDNETINSIEKMIILDGQHRTGALNKLSKECPDILEKKIRIDLYHVKNEEEALEIYNIINTSKKVELYTGNTEPIVFRIIQQYFLNRFGKFCKFTSNPRGLNISLDIICRKMQGYNMVNKFNITEETVGEWIEYIKELNNFYSEQSNQTLLSYGVKENIINEARNDNFYLGMFRNYEWIERLLERPYIQFQDQIHLVVEKEIKLRKRISRTLRLKVWEKRCNDKINGECFCCAEQISITNFDCGHTVSVKDGGSTDIDNLEPICRSCNLHMGTMNMNSYKKLFN